MSTPALSAQKNINLEMLRAAETGDLPSALRLLPHATNLVNPPGSTAVTPLYGAAKHGNAAIVRALLPLSRKGNPRDVIDALNAALFAGQPDCARELATAIPLGHFSFPGRQFEALALFERAIESGKNDAACLQIVFGVVGKAQLARCAHQAFRKAARFQKTHLLRMLLPFTDPNDQDEAGETALVYSCRPFARNPSAVDGRATAFLLPISDSSIRNKNGGTAWDVAFAHNAWPSLDILTLDRLRRNSLEANLRELVQKEAIHLPASSAFLEAEELAATVREGPRQASERPSAPAQGGAAPDSSLTGAAKRL